MLVQPPGNGYAFTLPGKGTKCASGAHNNGNTIRCRGIGKIRGHGRINDVAYHGYAVGGGSDDFLVGPFSRSRGFPFPQADFFLGISGKTSPDKKGSGDDESEKHICPFSRVLRAYFKDLLPVPRIKTPRLSLISLIFYESVLIRALCGVFEIMQISP
jgi:hypothetical protein